MPISHSCQQESMTIGQVFDVAGFTVSHRLEFARVPNARDLLKSTLKDAMAERRITQQALAKDAGLDQGYVSKLLNGQANATLDVIDKLAGALDRDAGDLLRHSVATASDHGGSDVPASTLARLQRENETLKTRLGKVQAITRELFRVAVGRKRQAARTRTS